MKMLPTKGFFQDIECPYYNSSCGRPYCHFRHRKKLTEIVDEVSESDKEETPAVPTYKPTPKSELANIHNKSHIPISYVPDLAFRPDRKARPFLKFEKPTYKPTPLSILSSANKRGSISEENGEHVEAIKEIKQNIANVEYDPTISLQPGLDINFEDLSTEFELIDEIINSSDKVLPQVVTECVRDTETKPILIKKTGVNKANSDEIKNHDKELSDIPETKNEQKPIENVKLKLSKASENKRSEKIIEKPNRCSDEQNAGANNDKTIGDKSKFKNSEKVPKDIKKEKCNKTHDTEKTCKYKKEKHDKSDLHSHKIVKVNKKEKHVDKSDKTSDSHSEKAVKHKKEKPGDVDSQQILKVHKNEKSEKTNEHSKRTMQDSKREKPSDKISESSDKYSHKRDKGIKKEKHSGKYEHNARSKSSSSSSSDFVKDKSSDRSDGKKAPTKKESRPEKRSSLDDDKTSTKDKKKDSKTSSERSHKSSNRDTHRKEEHKDRKNKHSSSESKHKIRDRSRSMSKEKQKSKEREKEKKRHREEKNKIKSKRRLSSEEIEKSRKSLRIEEPKVLHQYSDRNEPLPVCEIENNFSDFDFEDDDDETMRECYKIFNEYNPPERNIIDQKPTNAHDTYLGEEKIEYTSKKRVAHMNIENTVTYSQLHPPNKPKPILMPGNTLANRYKLAKLAQAEREQELLMNEIHYSTPVKRSAPTLLEAARERKRRRDSIQLSNQSSSLVDDILKGTTQSSASQPKILTKKIAPAQNVSLMAKAKERISRIKQAVPVKTVAQTQKNNRVAHVPDISLSDIPDVLQAEKSKLPVNVRTRFLTMIADECVQLYISKAEAFTRALSEEFACYEKCKVLATYRNSAMLAVNRLRKEIQERTKTGLGLISLGEDSSKAHSLDNIRTFYDKVKKWILTEEELDIHGYPRESEEHSGRAVVKNLKIPIHTNLDDNQRFCARCHKIYQVDDDGWTLFEEECIYHPMKKRTIRGEQTYLCCQSSDGTGCATSDTHVSDGIISAELEGYQTTMDPEHENDPRSFAVYALDCEMCYTTKGLELTRVTIVDMECKTVYESLVKPLNPIIDYNTRFSGITKEQMDKTSTSILQIQANILHLCNSQTILVGHSLESDMKALKIVHGTVIDTAVLFPHKMGLPYKRALKALASEHLRKIIQNDVSGHDSAEDAITCMELLKWKLNDELKGRRSK